MWKLIGPPLIDIRIGDRSRSIRHHLDSEIHLEPGEPHHFFALFHSLRIDFRILRLGRVGIDAYLVAKLAAADQRIHRSVVDFPGNVPQGHFDCAHSSALSRVSPELLYLAENPVELEWIFANDTTLQE